jgi:spermidine/putrescine transport system substrate-binding protein
MTERITRDELLRRGAAGASILTIPGLLAACGGSESESADTPTGSAKVPHDIHFSNWTLYMDGDEKTGKYPTLEAFEKKYGVHVKYTVEIVGNETFFAKIQPQLSRGKSTGSDLIVMTDNSPYPALLIEKGWVEKIDKSVFPNRKNLLPSLAHPDWDPNRDYSMPWQSGMVGLATNTKITGKPVTSVDQLLNDSKLHGQVTLFDSMGDTMPLVMLANGDDPTKVTDQTFDAALNRIKKAVSSGQIRDFTDQSYVNPLVKGDLAAAFSWSGDVVSLLDSNPNLVWNIPDAGGSIWTDQVLIPNGGDVYTASLLLNWYYRPTIAAKLAAFINYVTPVAGVQEVFEKTDPKLAKNPLIFPTKNMLSRVHFFDPKALRNPDYQEKWTALVNA